MKVPSRLATVCSWLWCKRKGIPQGEKDPKLSKIELQNLGKTPSFPHLEYYFFKIESNTLKTIL
jgi:hypothetical protein